VSAAWTLTTLAAPFAPAVDGPPGVCAWCGSHAAATAELHVSENFSAWSELGAPWSDRACPGCAWLAGETGLPTRSGRGRHPWTLYSLCAHPGGLERASKSEKDVVRRWLLDPPGPPVAICVSDSGKKHLAYRTPINYANHRIVVRFDEILVDLEPRSFAAIVADAESLLAQGLPKRDVTSGDTSVTRLSRLDRAGREAWDRLRRLRGTGQLELAVWVATSPTREETP
jgi:CRISPR type IV-associated protein Csf1